MRKQYWWILAIYVIMQLSGFIGLPFLIYTDLISDPFKAMAVWSLVSFAAALIPILILTNRTKEYPFRSEEQMSAGMSTAWIIFGVFLALFVQGLAGVIETTLFKVEAGSENTDQLVDIALSFPFFFLVFVVIGPILEEIVFRKVIFGSLYTRFNFWISVLISSLIFGVVHGELEHLLIYTSMGATFAFLYIKSKRLIVPIATHILMNAFAAIAVVNYDKLEELQNNLQQFIGGF